MTREILEIAAPDGAMRCVLCRPDAPGPRAGVLVLMEAYGLNAHIGSVCERLAAEGYVALAPDLYYRDSIGSSECLTIDYDDTDRAVDLVMRTVALSNAPEERVKDERLAADLASAVTALKELPAVRSDAVAALGFCMGGRLAFLAGCRLGSGLAAVVSFYGGRIVPLLDEARSLEAPTLLLFGEQDSSIPLAQVDRIRAELEWLEKSHEIATFPDAGHGFFCEARPSYSQEAARDAWQQTLDWLGKHL